jgi:hypothetical protein
MVFVAYSLDDDPGDRSKQSNEGTLWFPTSSSECAYNDHLTWAVQTNQILQLRPSRRLVTESSVAYSTASQPVVRGLVHAGPQISDKFFHRAITIIM